MSPMTELVVHSRFRLRGLWCDPGVLGSTTSWATDDRRIDLRFPTAQTDFNEPDHPEEEAIPAWVPTHGNGGPAGGVIVNLIKTEVRFTGTMSAATKEAALQAKTDGDDVTFDEFNRAVQVVCTEGHVAGERIVHKWLAHIRTVTDQPWLGLRAEQPLQHGRCWLEDRHAGVRLIQLGPLQSATIRLGIPLLSASDLEAVADRVARGHEPAAADSLLADARFLATEADVVDAQRAVLIAAMACEVKTKHFISERADPRKRALVQLLLKRTSNLPGLADDLLSATFGVSLRHSDPALFKSVQRLTELRNQIVHRGYEVDRDEGRRVVVGAKQYFDWLDSLATAVPSTPP